ncbi:MAG: 50S ribosomal protein L18, partial [Bdellovibrionota bacterium]
MKKVSKKTPESLRNRLRRKKRISFKVKGTAERPRLAIFRSNKAFYAQIIDDAAGRTLASASSLDAGLRKDLKGGSDSAAAEAVGKLLA